MLQLHTWSTQNARKISIMLHECDLPYELVGVDIQNNEQSAVSFVGLNPNGKIPVLVDTELCDTNGKAEPIFETGAILLHLAEKTGRFLPQQPADRMRVLKWLFWQVAGMGPNFGNFSHFAAALVADESQLNQYLAKTRAPEPNDYAITRFSNECFRLLAVLDNTLANKDYIAGDVSIADFACYPWVESAWQGFSAFKPDLAQQYAAVSRWLKLMSTRPAVAKGMQVLAWDTKL